MWLTLSSMSASAPADFAEALRFNADPTMAPTIAPTAAPTVGDDNSGSGSDDSSGRGRGRGRGGDDD